MMPGGAAPPTDRDEVPSLGAVTEKPIVTVPEDEVGLAIVPKTMSLTLVTVADRRTVAIALEEAPVVGTVGLSAAHTLKPEAALVAVLALSPRIGKLTLREKVRF